MSHGDAEFNRGAVRPIECYVEGWRLIKDDYLLFFGMAFVGMLIAYTVPFGLLFGPIWCGIGIYLLGRMDGKRPGFGTLFEGFNYLGPSIGPGILLVTLATAGFAVVWVAYFAATMAVLFAEMGQGNAP